MSNKLRKKDLKCTIKQLQHELSQALQLVEELNLKLQKSDSRVASLELTNKNQQDTIHRVMEKETDDKVAVGMVTDSQNKFPHLKVVSFDKGFHSPDNQEQLGKVLETVALPRKGRLSKNNQDIENSAAFRKARNKHSAVESAINGLEVHGLDCCPDRGISGFRRYVALAVVARNLHRIGEILYRREQKSALRLARRQAANAANMQRAA